MNNRNTIYNVFGNFVPLIINFIILPHYLKLIGNSNYGIISFLMILLTFISLFDIGIGKSIVIICKNINFKSRKFSNYFYSAIYVLIIISIIFIISLYYLSGYIVDNLSGITEIEKNNIKNCFYYLYYFIPIYLLLSLFKSILLYKFDFGFVNLFEALANILSTILPFIYASQNEFNLEILILLTIMPRFFLLLIIFIRIFKFDININHDLPNKNRTIELINSGKWLMYLSILAYTTVSVEKIYIGKILEFEKLTLYTISFDLSSKLMLISSAFSNTIYSVFLRNNNINEKKINDSEKSFIYIITLLSILGIFYINDFLALWINKDFANDSKYISEIILCGVWFNSIALYSQTKIIANDEGKKLFYVQIKILISYIIILLFITSIYNVIIASILWTSKTLIESSFILYKSNTYLKVIKNNYINLILIIISFINLILINTNQVLKFIILFIIVIILTLKYLKKNND